MRRKAIDRLQPRTHGAGALSMLTYTMFVTPVAAQDEDRTANDAGEETPLPPLPAAAPAPSVATDPTPPPAAAPADRKADPTNRKDGPEELVVTGSRIRRTDISTPAPTTTLDRQKLDSTGLGSIGRILQQLPSQSNAINEQFNNGGDGSSTVNLRGISESRTLVLLNGRRFVAGGLGANASVDLNAIPLSIIDRVEVLKDGASAMYGSDAIGGVVNIITRRDFSGLEASLYTGAGQHGGLTYQVSATGGEVTEKASVMFAFEYYNQGEIFAGEREFSAVDRRFDFRTFEESTLGSSAVPQGFIVGRNERDAEGNVQRGNADWQALLATLPPGATPSFYKDPVTGWRQYRGSGTSDRGAGDQYNYQPENYLLTPQERYNIFTIGHYNVLPNVRGYFEGSYTNRRSDQLLASMPLFTLQADITVSGQNIYNTFGKDFTDVRRRMVEAGNRNFIQSIDTYRTVLGFDGRLTDDAGRLSEWRWDARFVYGRTEGTSVSRGRFVKSRLINALGPSFVDDSDAPVCGTEDNPIAGCVPLNLFGGAGTITPEMLDYVQYEGTSRGFSEQQIWGADLNGPLFSLFDKDVGLAVGYQHRREAGAFVPDAMAASGDTVEQREKPTRGDYHVNAAYAEIGLPIALRVPGIEELALNAAARLVDFSSFGLELTWKLAAQWKVFEHVAFRGTAARSFRAPSIGELFGGQGDGFLVETDPCDETGTLDATTRANCIADRIITANPNDPPFTGDQAFFPVLAGGNPELDAETAFTFTAGMVITPKFGKWTEGLSIAVDYFNLIIEGPIASIGSSAILSNCYTQAVRKNCDLVQRDPASKLITRIVDLAVNIGQFQTAGIDFSVAYRVPTEAGRFGLTLDGTWLERYDNTQADGDVVETLGNNGADNFPRLRINAGLRYEIERFGTGLNVNYIGPFQQCGDADCTAGPASPGGFTPRNVESWISTDIYASYRISSPLGLTSLSAGINNLADTEPPIIYQGLAANSDPASYDFVGRYFYFRLSHVL